MARLSNVNNIKSLWAGTHLRIKNISVLASGIGKTTKVFVFTEFCYLTPSEVSRLLHRWLKVAASNECIKKMVSAFKGVRDF